MLALQYETVFNNNVKGFIRTEWKYIGTTYFDLANTIKQNPYSLLNASAGIQINDISFKIWTRNLSNQHYIAYAYDFGAVHLGDPATSGLTISARF